ncbi:MAG TPA: hypothetical protein VFA45_24060 [Actinomycetes bacterium]|jgi:hypothetical protein|nr:hypothetical protein [Actinomycetes bacterium]
MIALQRAYLADLRGDRACWAHPLLVVAALAERTRHPCPSGLIALTCNYVSNTDSNTLSGYTLGTDGAPALIGTTGIVATTESGAIDSAASSFRSARWTPTSICVAGVAGDRSVTGSAFEDGCN